MTKEHRKQIIKRLLAEKIFSPNTVSGVAKHLAILESKDHLDVEVSDDGRLIYAWAYWMLTDKALEAVKRGEVVKRFDRGRNMYVLFGFATESLGVSRIRKIWRYAARAEKAKTITYSVRGKLVTVKTDFFRKKTDTKRKRAYEALRVIQGGLRSDGVYRASTDDIPEVVRMGERFVKDAKLGDVGLLFDRALFKAHVEELMASQDQCVLVGYKNGIVVGMLLGGVMPFIGNTSQYVAQEYAWWVDKEARGTGLAKKLMDQFVKWAKQKDAKIVMMGSIQSLEGDRVARIYERSGYRHFQSLFVRAM